MHTTPTTTPTTTLYIARHGQSELNNQSLVTGQLDPVLTDKGRAQSHALAECLRGEALAAIYSSTLGRTIETATPTAAATRLPIVRVAALCEIHMGELQGRHRDARDAEAQALWARWQAEPWSFCVPGGERFDTFAQRVGAALQTILERHAGQRVLVVGHGATNRVLLGTLLRWPRERWFELRPRNKFCYRLQLDDATPRIATYTLGGKRSGRCEEGLITA